MMCFRLLYAYCASERQQQFVPLISRLHDEDGSRSQLDKRLKNAKQARLTSQLHECLQYQTRLQTQALIKMTCRAILNKKRVIHNKSKKVNKIKVGYSYTIVRFKA